MATETSDQKTWIQKTSGVCGGRACIRNTRNGRSPSPDLRGSILVNRGRAQACGAQQPNEPAMISMRPTTSRPVVM